MGCTRLLGDYLEVIWEVFCEDFEGKTIQRVNAKTATFYFLLINIALDSLFIEGGVARGEGCSSTRSSALRLLASGGFVI